MMRCGPWAMGMAALLALTCWSQGHLPNIQDHNEHLSTHLHPMVLRALAFGHRQTMADLMYVQAVSLWGQRTQAPHAYQNLAPLLQRTVALDARYEGAYLLAGTALTLEGMDKRLGMALLREGAQMFPNHWRLQFLYGFNAYDIEHDDAAAAKSLAAAAVLPQAPAYLPMLAASISARAHNYELGIAMLEALLQQTIDPEDIRAYHKRIARLRAQQQGPRQKGSPP